MIIYNDRYQCGNQTYEFVNSEYELNEEFEFFNIWSEDIRPAMSVGRKRRQRQAWAEISPPLNVDWALGLDENLIDQVFDRFEW